MPVSTRWLARRTAARDRQPANPEPGTLPSRNMIGSHAACASRLPRFRSTPHDRDRQSSEDTRECHTAAASQSMAPSGRRESVVVFGREIRSARLVAIRVLRSCTDSGSLFPFDVAVVERTSGSTRYQHRLRGMNPAASWEQRVQRTATQLPESPTIVGHWSRNQWRLRASSEDRRRAGAGSSSGVSGVRRPVVATLRLDGPIASRNICRPTSRLRLPRLTRPDCLTECSPDVPGFAGCSDASGPRALSPSLSHQGNRPRTGTRVHLLNLIRLIRPLSRR